MQYTLKKKQNNLFVRAARHWWLTGFMLGEYSKPSELTMEAVITLKDIEMRQAFVGGLKKIGYTEDEYRISYNTVVINYGKPHTPQPLSRRGLIAWAAMLWDRWMVRKYKRMTKGLDNMYDILITVQKKSPRLYRMILNMGKQEKIYKPYDAIKDYIEQEF